jgi:hypothetical protein
VKALILLLLRNFRELLIALDQVLNVVVTTLTLQPAYAGETLSAHCWRAYRDGKVWGLLLMPAIDLLFSWQAADPRFKDPQGLPLKGHCRRAYEKEKAREYLPPEYSA